MEKGNGEVDDSEREISTKHFRKVFVSLLF